MSRQRQPRNERDQDHSPHESPQGIEAGSEKHNLLLEDLQKALGYHFKDLDLLRRALTHASYANERNRGLDNQRMEFLGDSVLGLAISTKLFHRFTKHQEGRLSRLRSKLVCEETLARKAQEINLGECILLGKGEQSSGGKCKASLLSDAYEAVLAAIFLDAGYETARDIIQRAFHDEIDAAARDAISHDFKSRLQEVVQSNRENRPRYTITDMSGPPHKRTFTAIVKVKDEVLGTGIGMSKKAAQQAAAHDALQNLERRAQDAQNHKESAPDLPADTAPEKTNQKEAPSKPPTPAAQTTEENARTTAPKAEPRPERKTRRDRPRWDKKRRAKQRKKSAVREQKARHHSPDPPPSPGQSGTTGAPPSGHKDTREPKNPGAERPRSESSTTSRKKVGKTRSRRKKSAQEHRNRAQNQASSSSKKRSSPKTSSKPPRS